MPVRAHLLERGGRPEYEDADSRTQRALDGINGDLREVEAMATDATRYSASGADWVAPAPTTTQEAITRIAAGLAGLIGPIP